MLQLLLVAVVPFLDVGSYCWPGSCRWTLLLLFGPTLSMLLVMRVDDGVMLLDGVTLLLVRIELLLRLTSELRLILTGTSTRR